MRTLLDEMTKEIAEVEVRRSARLRVVDGFEIWVAKILARVRHHIHTTETGCPKLVRTMRIWEQREEKADGR